MIVRVKLVILLLLNLLVNVIAAQSIIKGTIADKQKTPIDGCVVFLLHKTSLLLADNTLSDTAGHYQVSASTPGEYIIEFRNLAYKDSSLTVKVESQPFIIINPCLEERVFDLQSIEVIDKLIGIRRVGDTLFYNTHAYKDGSERFIEDILRKLPGIEVTQSGQVSYMGKTVDALLIDGNDLSGNQHFNITQNFQSEDVDRVQIIENYIGEFDGTSHIGENEKVAMNIEFNHNKENTTSGNIVAGLGFNEHYFIKLNILRSAHQGGFSLFSGSSNFYHNPQSGNNFAAYDQTQLQTIGTQQYTFINYDLYLDPIFENRFIDHFFQISETSRINSAWSRRTFIDLRGGFSRSQTQSIKFRFSDQSEEQIFQTQKSDQFSILLDHDSKFQISPMLRAIAKAKVRMIIPNIIQIDTGFVNNSQYLRDAASKKQFNQVEFQGLFEWVLHTNQTLKIFGNYSELSIKSDWNIISDTNLFGYSTINNFGQYFIQYDDYYLQKGQEMGLEWLWTRSNSEISVFCKRKLLKEDLSIKFPNIFIAEAADFKSPLYEAGVSATFHVRKFKINSDLTIIRSGYQNTENKINYQFLPSLKFSRDLGKTSVFAMQIRKIEMGPALLYLHQLPLIIDPQTITKYELPTNQHISSWTGTISLQQKPGSLKNVFIANLSATWTNKTLISSELSDGNHFNRVVNWLPPNKVFRFFLFGWHTTSTFQLNFNNFLVFTDGHSVFNNNTINFENLWTRSILSFAYKGLKGYELSVSPEIQYQRQKIDEIENSWVNPVFTISARSKGPNWGFSIDFSQNINRTNNEHLNLQLLNFSIDFLKLKPLQISLQGNNVLNISTYNSLTAIINPIYSNTILSEKIPGSVLLVVRYDF